MSGFSGNIPTGKIPKISLSRRFPGARWQGGWDAAFRVRTDLGCHRRVRIHPFFGGKSGFFRHTRGKAERPALSQVDPCRCLQLPARNSRMPGQAGKG